MPRKSSALRAAPPIRPPSTSSFAKISAALRGLARTAVKDRRLFGCCAEFLGQHLADVGVDLLRLLGRCGLARADGPNGFVCDHELLVLLGGEVVNDLFDLRLHYVEVLAGFTLFEVLAHAVDRRQAVGVSLRHLLVERLGGLAVVLAALRVAEDHVLAAQRRDHRSGDLARVGAFGFGGAVLRAECDIRTLERFGDRREVRERRAYDEINARANFAAACDDVSWPVLHLRREACSSSSCRQQFSFSYSVCFYK